MHTTRTTLSYYLLRCTSLQTIGESIRQSIAKNPFCQLQTIFQRLDRFRRGSLVPEDFSEFLLENGVYAGEREVYVVFRDFDRGRLGFVTLEAFQGEVMPRESGRLRRQALSRKYYKPGHRLEVDLEYLVAKYLQHKIRMHNELQTIRLQLQELSPSYVQESFSMMDRRKQMQLTPGDIDYFLRSNGKVTKHDQTQRIMRVLSLSHQSQVDKLSYDGFFQHLNPFGRGFYAGYVERLVEKRNLERQYLQRKVVKEEEERLRKEREMEMQREMDIQRIMEMQRKREKEIEADLMRSHLLEEKMRRRLYY